MATTGRNESHHEEDPVRALLPDDRPRFLTFVFGLPFQLPLPHRATVGQQLRTGLLTDPSWHVSKHIKNVGDDEITPEPVNLGYPFVSLKIWQPKITALYDLGQAGITQVVGTLSPPMGNVEEMLKGPPPVEEDSYRTVIEAVTQGAPAESEAPAPNVVAQCFNRCLLALNQLIDAYAVALDDFEYSHISAAHLGAMAYAWSRPAESETLEIGPVLYVLPMAPRPSTSKEIIEQDGWDAVMHTLGNTWHGQPFVAAKRYYQLASRALYGGEHGQALVLIATAMEISLNALLRSIVVESEGVAAARHIFFPADRRGGLNARLRSQYAIRLGGGDNWNPDVRESKMAGWWTATQAVRGRVVHGGYQPTPQEAHDAVTAAEEMDSFIDDRLAAKKLIYPLTVLSKLGTPGLESRGQWSRKMREKAAEADVVGHWAMMGEVMGGEPTSDDVGPK